MQARPPKRWITKTVEQTQNALPELPWTRRAKLARRMARLQKLAV